MKISDSLEQLASYNLQKRASAGRLDASAEKINRFNTILDVFAEKSDTRKAETNLAALELMASPVQSSLYGRMLQVLSTQLATDPLPPVKADLISPPAPGPVVSEAGRPSRGGQASNRAETLGETERINRSVARAAEKYNLPESLIKGVIKAESAYDPRAVSPAGARGLMQLMPATARELGVTDAFDIEQNIDGGARYLKQMLDRFDNDVAKALAAYNAGPGTVVRYRGKVPYRETIAYVDRVLSYAKRFA